MICCRSQRVQHKRQASSQCSHRLTNRLRWFAQARADVGVIIILASCDRIRPAMITHRVWNRPNRQPAHPCCIDWYIWYSWSFSYVAIAASSARRGLSTVPRAGCQQPGSTDISTHFTFAMCSRTRFHVYWGASRLCGHGFLSYCGLLRQAPDHS